MKFFIIIIILSYHKHEYPGPSFATSPNRSSPLAGPQGYIPYPHRAAVCVLELVVLLLLGHMWGVHRSTSLMSSFLLLKQCPACLVRLTLIVFVIGGKLNNILSYSLLSYFLSFCCVLVSEHK